MLKKIIVSLFGVALIGAIGCGAVVNAKNPAELESPVSIENYYPETAVVVALGIEDDLVVLKDSNGQHWCFSGTEDWMVGDVAALMMYDNGTEIIYDDEIVTAQYSGYQSTEIY